MRRIPRTISCLLLAVAAMGTPAIASELSEEAVAGCVDNLESIRSGVCRISMANDPSAGPARQVDIFTAFDVDAGLLRFDRLAADEKGVPTGGQLIRTPEHIFQVVGDSSSVVMRSTNDGESHPAISAFDVRSLGLFTFGGPSSLVGPFAFFDRLSEREDLKVLEQGDLIQLSWAQNGVESDLWLDSSKGYGWVAYHIRPEGETISIETSWEPHGGVWVPSSTKVSRSSEPPGAAKIANVTWESVNEEVDPTYFDPDTLADDRTISMYSDELGEPVFLGALGDPSGPGGVSELNGGTGRGVIVAIAAVVALAVLGACVYYFRKGSGRMRT